MPDITILNGRKHKMKHELSRRGARHARRNPDESLASQAGSAALATVIAAPAAIILDRAISGMKKKDGTLLYTENQSAMLLGAIGVVGGVALHIKGFSPKTGVALVAACGTLAGRRALAARKAVADAAALALAHPTTTVLPGPTETVVTAPPATDFTLVVTPVTASVTPLATAVVTQAYTITVAARGTAALAGPVAISVTGLSAGVTSALSRLSLAAGETSTLTLSVPQASPAATVAFSIAGTNSTGTVAASATLVVGTAASAGPYGYTRRAGAVYPMQYGQVSRLTPSGEALSAEQWQGYSLERPRIVPATATAAQIQGECGPSQTLIQQPFGMPTMPSSMELPTAKRQQDMQLDSILSQIGADADRKQAMLMEQGMPQMITNGRNFGNVVMEGQDVMASKGAGGQWSDEQAQQRATMIQAQEGVLAGRSNADQIRRARREQLAAQECVCASSPSGARVLRRGRI